MKNGRGREGRGGEGYVRYSRKLKERGKLDPSCIACGVGHYQHACTQTHEFIHIIICRGLFSHF